MFDYAVTLRDQQGWSVIPIPHAAKRARVKWSRFQQVRADDATLRRWFKNGGTNIAVITGELSRLVVRDFDEIDAYHHWAEQHPALAAICPTATTARGAHVYCRMDPMPRVLHIHAGELRGEGGYCLLPPSVHPSGAVYKWMIPLGSLPSLSFTDFDLTPPKLKLTEGLKSDFTEADREHTDSTQKRTDSTRIVHQQNTECHGNEREVAAPLSATSESAGLAMRSAVLASIPVTEGQREKRLWQLARRLLSVYGRGANYQTLRPAFDLWWSHSKEVVSTKSPEDSLAALLRAYARATTPLDDVLGRCVATAKDSSAPEWSKEFSTKCQLLASLCRELQRFHGDKEFPLGCRIAGTTVGVSHVQAASWLGLFVSMGALALVRPGDKGGGLAARYRYVADDQ